MSQLSSPLQSSGDHPIAESSSSGARREQVSLNKGKGKAPAVSTGLQLTVGRKDAPIVRSVEFVGSASKVIVTVFLDFRYYIANDLVATQNISS